MIERRPRAVCIALSLAMFAACQAPGPSADVRSARRASLQRNWALAADAWNRVWLESGFTDGEAALGASRALSELGDVDSALGVLRARLDAEPQDIEALGRAGALEWERGRAEAAAVYLERAIELTVPAAAPQIALDLARVRRARGDAAGAASLVDQVLRAAAENGAMVGTAAVEFARATAQAGRDGEALDAYALAFARGSGTVDDALEAARLVLERAATTAESAESPEAGPPLDGRPLEWLAAAQEFDPQRTEIPRTAAELALALGDAGRAVSEARRALESDPGDLAAVELLVRALVADGRVDDARAALEHGRALPLSDEERARVDALERMLAEG